MPGRYADQRPGTADLAAITGLLRTLAEAGWPIADAEAATAAQLPAWASAPAGPVSVFAAANARVWQATTPPEPHWSHRYRARIAAQWADHRRSQT